MKIVAAESAAINTGKMINRNGPGMGDLAVRFRNVPLEVYNGQRFINHT